jgi:cytochrome c biogenesis protein CcdA
MNLKRLVQSIFLGAVFITAPLAHASTNITVINLSDIVRIEMFGRDACTHCQDEKNFLKELKSERSDFEVVYHDIADPQEKTLFDQLAVLEGLPKVTPITLIDRTVVQGFSTPETTGKRMMALIDGAKGKKQMTVEEFIAAGGSKRLLVGGETCDSEGNCPIPQAEYLVDIPFFGAVDVAKYSLPVLSLVLGFVDGFNPCAMWVLVLFLTILLESGSRRRMFEMAGLFIFAEAVMYYLILNVWMSTWDFVGMDGIVTPIVGTVAVGAGLFFLYNFYKADTSCKVGNLSSKKRTAERIKHYATVPMNIPVALGILGLAFSVNIIEFACSVGIPQTFTKVLDLNYLSFAGRQFYNALYILMYMIDDLVVFALALYSFDKIGLTTAKYTRFSHFVGGVLMMILGLILLIRPTILVFG